MRVPVCEDRLTGHYSRDRENRRISGSPPGMPQPAIFPSRATLPANAAWVTGQTKTVGVARRESRVVIRVLMACES